MSSGPRHAALLAVLLASCSGAGADVGPTVDVATPAAAPQPRTPPVGEVLRAGAQVTALAVDPYSRTLAVGVRDPDRLLLLGLDDFAAVREISLTGTAAELTPSDGVLLASLPDPRSLVEFGLPDGTLREEIGLDGPVRDATVVADRTVVALGDRLAVLDGGVRTIPGFADAAQLVAVGNRVAVLDRAQTSLAVVEPATGREGPALRAGNGATSAVGDRFGRILVVDTRQGELLAFSGDPLLLRQRFPVPGAPYGLAYDARHDLAWVTLTARNEVVGFDMAGGEPVERHRFPTVQQPDSVAVDSRTGRVVVGSSSGAGVQVIDPGQVVQ
ncbi:MAG: YncE family protein [Pseudonocardiaceae bacterium]